MAASMMRIYLPDTNAVSRFARGIDAGLHARFVEGAAGLRLSALVWYELRYGAERRPDLPRLERRLELLREILREVEPFEEEAAWHAARVRCYLEQLKPNAQPIGHYDLLIAGHALSLGATLVTANVNEFSRVPGLSVENWQSA